MDTDQKYGDLFHMNKNQTKFRRANLFDSTRNENHHADPLNKTILNQNKKLAPKQTMHPKNANSKHCQKQQQFQCRRRRRRRRPQHQRRPSPKENQAEAKDSSILDGNRSNPSPIHSPIEIESGSTSSILECSLSSGSMANYLSHETSPGIVSTFESSPRPVSFFESSPGPVSSSEPSPESASSCESSPGTVSNFEWSPESVSSCESSSGPVSSCEWSPGTVSSFKSIPGSVSYRESSPGTASSSESSPVSTKGRASGIRLGDTLHNGFDGLRDMVPLLQGNSQALSKEVILNEATRYIQMLRKKVEDRCTSLEDRHRVNDVIRSRLSAMQCELTKREMYRKETTTDTY